MKNITSSLTGLASSLLLNVGLSRVAQKFDPVSSRPCNLVSEVHGPAYCAPCGFTPKQRM